VARAAAALLALALAPGVHAAERAFTLAAVGGAVPPAQQALRVAKGDTVVVSLASDQPGEVHLHAYRLHAKVAPAQPASWRFTAHATGRFRIEWHAAGDPSAGHHRAPLATLEVMPK